MIHSSVQWTLYALLGLLLLLQAYLLVKNPTLPFRKKALRGLLNFLLWLTLAGFVLQLSWPVSTPARHVLLAGSEVPAATIDTLKERYQVSTESITSADSVTLVGSGFSMDQLQALSSKSIRWIPYYAPGSLNHLQYKALLRKGERQVVTGMIQVPNQEKSVLKVQYGNHTLDSLILDKGVQNFRLSFPSFAKGRTQTELFLNGKILDTLRFFSTTTPPLQIQFLLGNPDFESKTLAEWLGKSGHSVQMETVVSKDMGNTLKINQPGKADVYITDPDHASDPSIKKAVAQGKSVLFMNAVDAEADTRKINQALDTNWKVRKLSNDASVPLAHQLTGLPYEWLPSLRQQIIPGYPIAIDRGSSKVGVSLINETYPLQLSGDSIAYENLWTAVLAELQPTLRNTLTVNAPLAKHIRATLQLNNLSETNATLRFGADTVTLQSSPINPASAEALIIPHQTGWVTCQDSLEIFIESEHAPSYPFLLTQAFVKAHSNFNNEPEKGEKLHSIPDGFWLLLLFLCFTALWAEAKFN